MSEVLKLAPCSHAAAEFAVKKWHYSGCLPASKSQYIGVWENGKYIGAVIFGAGAGNITKGKQYGLTLARMVELTRVALDGHDAPVSKIVSIALKILKRKNPDLRMVVSLADPVHGHVGAIYQAGGWAYVGKTAPSKTYIGNDGREYHERVVSPTGKKKQYGRYVPCLKPSDAASIRMNPGKHKYLYPLDDAMRKQIEPLRKPYPKKVRGGSDTVDTAGVHPAEGGSTPTPPLHISP